MQANKEICFNVGQIGNSVLMNTIYLLFEPKLKIILRGSKLKDKRRSHSSLKIINIITI